MKIMKTIIEKIDKNQKNTDIIREAGRILKEGGLVAFPTETVYLSLIHISEPTRRS